MQEYVIEKISTNKCIEYLHNTELGYREQCVLLIKYQVNENIYKQLTSPLTEYVGLKKNEQTHLEENHTPEVKYHVIAVCFKSSSYMSI
jgi:hypothetical protein